MYKYFHLKVFGIFKLLCLDEHNQNCPEGQLNDNEIEFVMRDLRSQTKYWEESSIDQKLRFWRALQANYAILEDQVIDNFNVFDNLDEESDDFRNSCEPLNSAGPLKTDEEPGDKNMNFNIYQSNLNSESSEESKHNLEYSGGSSFSQSSNGSEPIQNADFLSYDQPKIVKNMNTRVSHAQLSLFIHHSSNEERMKIWKMLTMREK